MPRLTIYIGTWIHSHDHEGIRRPNGPLFHRWLPNGRENSLSLSSPDEGWELDLWFERRGYRRENSFIEFDHERHEVDATILERQAVLDAGPVRGELRLDNVEDSVLAAVVGDQIGSEPYVTLGSQVRRIVDSALVRLTRLLRIQYGQYWIEQFEAFDSRRYSLGKHFSLLNAQWSTDDENRREFVPNEAQHAPIVLTMGKRSYDELLTRSDWADIQRLLEEGFEPGVASSLLVRAHELTDRGRFRHALIEAVSALEVAIEDRLWSYIGGNERLQKSVQSFYELPLPARLIAIGSGLATEKQLEAALAAIKRRNTIVHDGREPNDADESHARVLIDVARCLIPGKPLKLGSLRLGNELRAKVEDWDSNSASSESANAT